MKRIRTSSWADQCLFRRQWRPSRLASVCCDELSVRSLSSTTSAASRAAENSSFPSSSSSSPSSYATSSSSKSQWGSQSSPWPPQASSTLSHLTPASITSPALSALHARLSLPSTLPLSTLALTLRHQTSTRNPTSTTTNTSLALLGSSLMSYHLSEYLLAHYPRLPLAVLFACMSAFISPPTLTLLVREWGITAASSPGPEVEPAHLQFQRLSPSTPIPRTDRRPASLSGAVIYKDIFGTQPPPTVIQGATTLENASASMVEALHGALYLHAGRSAVKQFFTQHILSRHLSLASLFDFRQPTLDLSRLCAREGFEGPVARIISETGRHSRHPVFLVGVYSGNDKLGEGSGASLNEARTRASVNALRAWYLYSPLGAKVPSDAEEQDSRAQPWKPIMIDGGEIVV